MNVSAYNQKLVHIVLVGESGARWPYVGVLSIPSPFYGKRKNTRGVYCLDVKAFRRASSHRWESDSHTLCFHLDDVLEIREVAIESTVPATDLPSGYVVV